MYDTPTFSFLRNTSDRSGSIEPGSFDATGLGSDWQLNSVFVSEGSGAAREFPCGEWLNDKVKSVRLQMAAKE